MAAKEETLAASLILGSVAELDAATDAMDGIGADGVAVDVSNPWEARVSGRYLEWCVEYKEGATDEGRFEAGKRDLPAVWDNGAKGDARQGGNEGRGGNEKHPRISPQGLSPGKGKGNRLWRSLLCVTTSQEGRAGQGQGDDITDEGRASGPEEEGEPLFPVRGVRQACRGCAASAQASQGRSRATHEETCRGIHLLRGQ